MVVGEEIEELHDPEIAIPPHAEVVLARSKWGAPHVTVARRPRSRPPFLMSEKELHRDHEDSGMDSNDCERRFKHRPTMTLVPGSNANCSDRSNIIAVVPEAESIATSSSNSIELLILERDLCRLGSVASLSTTPSRTFANMASFGSQFNGLVVRVGSSYAERIV